jgi:hypothetical protein
VTFRTQRFRSSSRTKFDGREAGRVTGLDGADGQDTCFLAGVPDKSAALHAKAGV